MKIGREWAHKTHRNFVQSVRRLQFRRIDMKETEECVRLRFDYAVTIHIQCAWLCVAGGCFLLALLLFEIEMEGKRSYAERCREKRTITIAASAFFFFFNFVGFVAGFVVYSVRCGWFHCHWHMNCSLFQTEDKCTEQSALSFPIAHRRLLCDNK